MRIAQYLTLFAAFSGLSVAQEKPVLDYYARQSMSAQHLTGGYHYGEVDVRYKNWIVADAFHLDFGNADAYRQLGIGGGRSLVNRKHFGLTEEVYYIHTSGTQSIGEKFILPWTFIGGSISKKWDYQAVFFPYLPLNDKSHVQFVLERARVRYQVTKKIGLIVGTGMLLAGDGSVTGKPLAGFDFQPCKKSPRFEFWFQTLGTHGSHVQQRLAGSLPLSR